MPPRCEECTRLWREFGFATEKYLNLVAKVASPPDELEALSKHRKSIRATIARHEYLTHGTVIFQDYMK